jgi:uncharacterized membrane protein YczE
VLQLYAGLITYGVSMALFVRSDLGNMPWDVFHQGLVVQLGGTIGRWSIAVGAIVLLLWIPLRERPGLGTISNVFVIGIFVDLTLSRLPELDHLAGRIGYVAAGVLLNAIATAAYIGARFGSGPRDGLMTGFTRRTRFSLRLVRTTIEVVVVVGHASRHRADHGGPSDPRLLHTLDTLRQQASGLVVDRLEEVDEHVVLVAHR